MKNNRFVFIIPFYNVKPFIEQCINSVLAQTYTNYIAIFADDQSTDGTSDSIPNDEKIIKIYNQKRLTALENIHNAIITNNLKDDDIVVVLDGDDFLLYANVLETLNTIYNDVNPLITYGQYVWPNGAMGHCYAYSESEFNNLRNMDWRASHLRTFRYSVYKELMIQDSNMNCYRDDNGEFYKITYDIAMLYPLMEIAGHKNIYFNSKPLYYYRLHPNNDHALNGAEQKRVEQHIKRKPKFKQAF
jgi:glycosyltransferase involved in cell wall biosynthesis